MEFQYVDSVEYMEEAQNEVYEYEQQNAPQRGTQQEDEAQKGILDETQEQQLENTLNDVEMTDENVIESSLGKHKYQEAEAIFREESKQIIFTQELETTTLSILGEQKSDLLQQITEQQKLIEDLNIDNESLERKAQHSNEEIRSLHQRILGNDVIVTKLKDFAKTMKTNCENIDRRNKEYFEKAQDQRKKAENLQSLAMSRINALKRDIEIKTQLIGDDDTKKMENENSLLNLRIAERRERLDKLIQQRAELETKSSYIISLREKKNSLEDELKGNISKLEKSKEDLRKCEIEDKEVADKLEKRAEQKKTEMIDFQNRIGGMEIEIQLRIKENEDIKIRLDEMLQSSSDAKQKLSELLKKIKDESSKVDSATENLEKLVNTNKSTLEPVQKEICLLKDQNVHMKETLEKKIKIYTDKLEEKNKIITTKMVLNEKVNLERQLEASIKQLDEQISLKKKKTEVLQGEVQRVIEDNSLQDLKKNKAYLISSREYLTEKFDNITARQNQAKSSHEAVQNQNYNLKIRLEERQKVVMNLKKQLEELEATKRTDPLTSILKRPVNSKLNSVSPKKVKFVDLKSFESSSLSGELAHEYTFEKLLEGFKKSNKSPQAAKKRNLDLE